MTRTTLAIAFALSLVACGEPAEEAAPETDSPAAAAPGTATEPDLAALVGDLRIRIDSLPARVGAEPAAARQRAVDLYVTRQEEMERLWGPHGSRDPSPALAASVEEAEHRFHGLMELLAADPPPDSAATAEAVGALDRALEEVLRAAARTDTELSQRLGAIAAGLTAARDRTAAVRAAAVREGDGPSPEIAALRGQLDAARAAYDAGDRESALRAVERAYLDHLEPLEPRLPADVAGRAERLFHLTLRPRIARGADAAQVAAAFVELDGVLIEADQALDRGGSFWLAAASSFLIVAREGLEAVLLIGAILAYLGRASGERRHRRQVWTGVSLGVAASFATWGVARSVVPVGGASRELIEGITALLAVGVLLYVSHWLFQKTYLHDWKAYLERKVGSAVAGGSALAMAGLAFAAVYREGFETVLFYQALLHDAGTGAVVAGFVPGILMIGAVGAGIIRLGLRLPLKAVFSATNGVLLYLAFVFLGKGLYNLQEAGLFAPHPLPWAPDHPALAQILGLHPTAETLGAQAAFLLALGATWALYRHRGTVARAERSGGRRASVAEGTAA